MAKREPWWVGRAKFLKFKAKPRWKVEAIAVELGRSVPEVRRVLGLQQPYSVPIEGPREGEPEWAPRARELRTKGKLSVQKIADEIGVSYNQAYRALHYERKRATDARHATGYKPREAELKRDRNRAKARKCERCGNPLSSPHVQSPICRNCQRELWTQKLEEAAELRRAGWSVGEIAKHMGQSSNSVGGMLTFARQRGIEVPYERKRGGEQ